MFVQACQQGLQNYVDPADAVVDAVPTTQQNTISQPAAAAQGSDPASAPEQHVEETNINIHSSGEAKVVFMIRIMVVVLSRYYFSH